MRTLLLLIATFTCLLCCRQATAQATNCLCPLWEYEYHEGYSTYYGTERNGEACDEPLFFDWDPGKAFRICEEGCCAGTDCLVLADADRKKGKGKRGCLTAPKEWGFTINIVDKYEQEVVKVALRETIKFQYKGGNHYAYAVIYLLATDPSKIPQGQPKPPQKPIPTGYQIVAPAEGQSPSIPDPIPKAKVKQVPGTTCEYDIEVNGIKYRVLTTDLP